MAKQLKHILKELEKRGFIMKNGNGSKCKLYNPDKSKPFYSLHIGERAIHPLNRFSKQNWGIDILSL